MSIIRTIVARMHALRRRRHADRDLDDELRAFVDARSAMHEARGLAPAEARRAALIEVGGVEQVKERVRDVRVGSVVATAVRDARYGARVLWRSPGYALVIVLTIALGIGVNVAMFSVMYAALWRSLPYPDADRIVTIEAEMQTLPSANNQGPVFDLREQSRLITHFAQIEGRDASLVIDGGMEHVAAARVTDDMLPLLGAIPALGRPIIVAEDLDGFAIRGVVISHDLWQRRFQSDPLVIGRSITVNNFAAFVVGVMPPDARAFLPAAAHVQEKVDVWLPRQYAPGLLHRGMPLFGRLAPGATFAQSQAELDGLAASFTAGQPGSDPNGLRITVRPLAEVLTRGVKPSLLALGATVGFVLLIACVNVANLMLVRVKARERELAVRRALGATRLRLIRQLLAEHMIVAGLGGACGLLLAQAGVGVLDWLRPVHLPRQSEVAIDAVVVAWTVGLTVATSVIVGLLPALALTRHPHGQPLHAGRAGSLMLRSLRMHRGLVVVEVALSIVPLIAAGLILRTFTNLLQAPIGFDPARVITARIPLNLQAFPTVERRSTFYNDAVARVLDLPGVVAAGVGGPPPLSPIQTTERYRRAEDDTAATTLALQQSVMPGYLEVMGIPLRAGRDISNDDIARQTRVAIVDERLAAQWWQGDAVGKLIGVGQSRRPLEVVGVAGPIRARDIRDASTPMVYVPSHVYEIEQSLVVKTRAPLATIGPEIKDAVEALGPGRPVFDIRPLDDIIAASIDNTRFMMLVLSSFAAGSLLLAGIGLYGTLAYLTAQRTQEFGVRLAMGAPASGILWLVLREGCALSAVGAALGLAGAFGTTRVLRGLLYGVTPLDAATIAGVVALVAVVAFAATSWPAWRAAHVNPVTALRAD